MLAAILHGKAGKISSEGEDISWRDLFRKREDLLTAAFFGRLLYLSSAMRKRALALLVDEDEDKWAADLGDIKKIVFWPSLRLSTDDGGRRVEPDVVIECENGLVMVEVKPPGGQQYEAQWHREVKALIETDKSKADIGFEISKIVHFLALGQTAGVDVKKSFEGFDTEGDFDFEPHQKEWEDILKGINSWAESDERGDRTVIDDWRYAFDLFGLHRPIKPLAELFKLLNSFEGSLSLLEKMRLVQPESCKRELSPLPWRLLLALSEEFFLEDSQCQSILKRLVRS